MINFKGDPTQALKALAEFTKDMLIGGSMTRKLRETHEVARDQVIQRLLGIPKSTKSNPSEFPIRLTIAAMITAETYRKGATIEGGVGNIELMDKLDPVHLLVAPRRMTATNPMHRLWRILETGTQKKYYLITPRFAPVLKFKIQPAGPYRQEKQVTHPGQEGFRYFAETAHWFSSVYASRVAEVLNEIVKKHSDK